MGGAKPSEETSCLAQWIGSSLLLKTCRGRASTTSGGKEFRLFTILKEEKMLVAGLGNISGFFQFVFVPSNFWVLKSIYNRLFLTLHRQYVRMYTYRSKAQCLPHSFCTTDKHYD